MNRTEATQYAQDKMKSLGLLEKGWIFKINDRLKSRGGQCRCRIFRFNISGTKKVLPGTVELAGWVLNAGDEVIKETILHEIAHAMTPGERHGFKWKQACYSIGSTGKTTMDNRDKSTIAAANLVKTKWSLHCSGCGENHPRSRRTRKSNMRIYKCRCGHPEPLAWIQNY